MGTGDSCHSAGKTNELKVDKIKEKKGGETGKLSVYRVHVHFVQIRGYRGRMCISAVGRDRGGQMN